MENEMELGFYRGHANLGFLKVLKEPGPYPKSSTFADEGYKRRSRV